MTDSFSCYDVAVVGAGPAGLFAVYHLLQKNPDLKIILLELGRPPGKRRRQLEGWLGSFMFGDGKMYLNDLSVVQNKLSSHDSVNSVWQEYHQFLSDFNKNKIAKDNGPSPILEKKILELNFSCQKNDYWQWRPDNIHALSRFLAEEFEKHQTSSSLTTKFDSEVAKIEKREDNYFEIELLSSEEKFLAQKVLIASGRSGWRWSSDLVHKFGINSLDTKFSLGIFLEFPAHHLKDFQHSNCLLAKNDFEIGPFSWHGTVIPEDHADFVLAAFRSNEDRWKSEKVSFGLKKKLPLPKNISSGVKETERLGKLAFLLFNDRVSRERIKLFLRGESQLSYLKEFDIFKEIFADLSEIIPDFGNRGYLHAPYFQTIVPEFQVDPFCQSDVENLYFAGESLGLHGIVSAILTGHLAAEGMMR